MLTAASAIGDLREGNVMEGGSDSDDSGDHVGLPAHIVERVKELESENQELRRTQQILVKALAYFSSPEFDRRAK